MAKEKIESIARLICRERGGDPDAPLTVSYPVNAQGEPIDGEGAIRYRLDAQGEKIQRRDEATGEPVAGEDGEPVWLIAPAEEAFDRGWEAYAPLAAKIAALD